MMMDLAKKLIVAVVVSSTLFACEPVSEDLFTRHFVVKKGQHYSTPRLAEMLQSNRLRFSARFNETAIYDFGDQALQTNKNKLLGFSDCNSMHHENSARFGWQWFNNRLEIYAYCYVGGQRTEEFVGVVGLNEDNTYEIELTEDAYIFYLNNERITSIGRTTDCNSGAYYLLYPYFGGSEPAPQDVRIDISIIR
jgi:hypothetical protein